MTSEEIIKIRQQYNKAKGFLCNISKEITLSETFNHVSGSKVQATAKIKGIFDLDSNLVVINTAIISTLGKDLENNWLKLNKQSSDRYKQISLEAFLNLPDWDNNRLLGELECKII